MKKCKTILLITGIVSLSTQAHALPTGFVYLKDIAPSIIQDIRYYSSNNFIGKQINGYEAPTCILTSQTALALASIQKELEKKSFSLKVYDCYRPTMAVANFITWSHDLNDQKQKKDYYPRVNKADFFKLGYVAEKSGHSRGSTVDITIVKLNHKHVSELNMGTHFDFMDELSHSLNPTLSNAVKENRLMLRTLMINHGFNPLAEEWWHFTLQHEPYPQTYFNFLIR